MSDKTGIKRRLDMGIYVTGPGIIGRPSHKILADPKAQDIIKKFNQMWPRIKDER